MQFDTTQQLQVEKHELLMATINNPSLPDDKTVSEILQAQADLEIAVLIGSRATKTASPESDWDIALQWDRQLDWLTQLGQTETLRRQLAQALRLDETHIDLVDLPRSNLAMWAAVAEEGKILKGENSLAWLHFLRRTWRELEDFYWDKSSFTGDDGPRHIQNGLPVGSNPPHV